MIYNRGFSLLYSLFALALLISACTDSQQLAILDKSMELGRNVASMKVKSFQTRDARIVYMENQTQGASVVLLHGFSAQKENWLAFANYLTDTFHIIVPDQAGHGQSSSSPELNYDLNLQAERLHQLMKSKGINKFHIVGNSMGGAISLLYTLRYPDEIQSLTLMNSAGALDAKASEYFQLLATGKNPLIAHDEPSFEFRLNFVTAEPLYIPWPLKPAIMQLTLAREQINKKIFSDMVATQEKLQREDFTHNLQDAIKAPTLIMWGEQDRVLDVSGAYRFQEKIPQAKIKIYPDIGHMPMVENPLQAAQDFTAFISSLTTP
jgi:pimeloyl-ACP methyl ester carboxylesterase